jgi:hypothetical protein
MVLKVIINFTFSDLGSALYNQTHFVVKWDTARSFTLKGAGITNWLVCLTLLEPSLFWSQLPDPGLSPAAEM